MSEANEAASVARYFLKPDHLDTWAEVAEEQFIRAEQNAGFRSKFGTNSVATGGFGGHGMRGRVVYPSNYDYYAEREPAFHALLVSDHAGGSSEAGERRG